MATKSKPVLALPHGPGIGARGQRKATRSTGNEPPAAPPEPAWRQPPPETRAKVRRKRVVMQTVGVGELRFDSPLLALPHWLLKSTSISNMMWRRWVGLLALAAVALGFSQLLTNEMFLVTSDQTQIRGAQRVSIEEIYRTSEMDRQNVFQIRPAAVAQRITRLPGVAGASVHLRLPAQAIIDVRELAPLAALQTITETIWVGTDGSPIQIMGEPPALTLVDTGRIAVDERGHLRPRILANLVGVRKARPDLTSLYYGKLEGLYFRAPGGWTVYLGEEGQIARKLALLDATERKIAERNMRVEVIDLRFDGYAALR